MITLLHLVHWIQQPIPKLRIFMNFSINKIVFNGKKTKYASKTNLKNLFWLVERIINIRICSSWIGCCQNLQVLVLYSDEQEICLLIGLILKYPILSKISWTIDFEFFVYLQYILTMGWTTNYILEVGKRTISHLNLFKPYDCVRFLSMFVKLASKKASYLGEDPVSKVKIFLEVEQIVWD